MFDIPWDMKNGLRYIEKKKTKMRQTEDKSESKPFYQGYKNTSCAYTMNHAYEGKKNLQAANKKCDT